MGKKKKSRKSGLGSAVGSKGEPRENVALKASVMKELKDHVYRKFGGKMRGHISEFVEEAVLARLMAVRAAGPVPSDMLRFEVGISSPPDRVFALVSDPARQPVWLTGLVAVKRLTPGPPAPGSRFIRIRQLPNGLLEVPVRVLVRDPVAGRYEDEITDNNLKGSRYRWIVEPDESGGSRVAVEAEFRVSGTWTVFRSAILENADWELQEGARRVKEMLESGSIKSERKK